ncbi:cytosol aminopeptidase, putative [Phytophthora infestans T30-4]|uniref:Cytosol aminopeptidase, putative n=1 Tax=Phytophthora infestans (strain T30-4) TaxID=403677 RepID=D0N253_PHYIT|nr:cytosol aminopeptidase, putative [Phytophthora infestans T30-4]EEY68382.1 cytosol aminopeptidase, putative [Phytophthora infestans T30-4]|eukprot:XP_002905541.1 cytosol aminopeptidase, putative [Phytophthora infestans T30-4]
MLRRFFSSSTAHRMVQQRVQGQLSLLAMDSSSPLTRVVFVSRSATADLQSSLPFPVSAAALRDFKAKPQEKLYLYPSEDNDAFKDQRVLLVGLGDANKVTPNVLRDATHGALSALKAKRAKDVVMQVPNLKDCTLDAARVVELLSQASMLSNYQFDQYLTDSKDVYGENKLRLPLEQIYLDTSAEFQKNVAEQVAVGEETIFARNLGNGRSHIVDPAFMEEVARASTELPNMTVRVLQQEDLEKEGMNMFLSVGQAGVCPPRLVILEYKGNPDSDEKVALVGKGITFDTGGLNLKPTGAIEDMHTDMCGSAAVLGAVRAASRQGLKVNIVCALALAENAIGSKAVKPLTIVKSHKGITVENNNTDAEGRLVLGDAMSYVQKEYKPKKIIDVATLTGACMVALGEHCAGLFSNSDDLAKKLQETGTECHERCWRLPILPEHTAALKGSQSDSRSTGRGRYGGASTAAAFLQQFVYEGIDWAHLDIAGPSNYSSPKSYFPKGATGFGVQLLYTYLKEHEQH